MAKKKTEEVEETPIEEEVPDEEVPVKKPTPKPKKEQSGWVGGHTM